LIIWNIHSFKKDFTEVKEIFHGMYSLSDVAKFHNNGVLYLFYLLMLTDSKPFRTNERNIMPTLNFKSHLPVIIFIFFLSLTRENVKILPDRFLLERLRRNMIYFSQFLSDALTRNTLT
jgi:hypothetical protein